MADFTTEKPCNGVLKFSDTCIVSISVDLEAQTVAIQIDDAETGERLQGICNLESEA